MSLDAAGLRVLNRSECLSRLHTVNIGRVALSHRALPMILPVRFRVDDERIMIRATGGTTLAATTDSVVVAFEAEGPIGVAEPSWSVIVHGFATHTVSEPEVSDAHPIDIAISIDEATGREVLAIPSSDGGLRSWPSVGSERIVGA